jgi:uncharacterized membrane protein
MTDAQVVRESESSLITTLHVTYALHAVGLAIGALGAASIVGSFVFGWPSIIAVIINYVKRGDARGTWLDSHFAWQIRTFWYAAAWAVLVFLVGLPLTLVIIGFAVWMVGFFILGVWAIYRIAKGWLALRDRRAVA